MRNITQLRIAKWYSALVASSALLVLLSYTNCFAQTSITWVPVGTDDWHENSNWDGNDFCCYVPEGQLGEQALIDNGGTAQVSTVYDNSGAGAFGPANIVIDNGTVEILGTGAMTLDGSRSISVGGAGTGTLTVHPGGMLDAGTISSAANNDSTINLTGNASLAVSGAFNPGGTTRINGSDVSFTAGSIGFGSASTFRTEITGPTFSTINVQSTAALGGTLDVDFSGVTPMVGDSWDLIDAKNVTGAFSTINLNGIGAVDPSLIDIRVAPGSIVQLAIEQKLSLAVDQTSGSVSIVNGGTSPVDFDGYTVHSPSGSLHLASWSSLQDNSSHTGWQTSESSDSTRVTETNPDGSTSQGGGTVSLGNIYTPQNATNAVLGQNLADVSFQYVTMAGNVVDGDVAYTGDSFVNNISLTVDPTTGEGQIGNPTATEMSIDGYTITSAGSLLDSWSGLENNPSASDWQKSESSSSTRLTETNPTSESSLTTSNGNLLSLGTIFNTALGEAGQDLVFEYLPANSVAPITGGVVYETITGGGGGSTGDYNGNGVVDAADYTLWADNLGTSNLLANDDIGGLITEAHYLQWKNNFGNTVGSGNAAAAAVPEPSSVCLLFLGCIGMCRLRRRGDDQ